MTLKRRSFYLPTLLCSPLKTNLVLSFVFLFLLTAKAQLVPVIVGDASDLGDNCYQITPDAVLQAGAVWYDNPIDLSDDFIIRFRANFGIKDANGADGTAFVLKQNPDPEIGNPGAGIGYQGITPSIVVEFDTWKNDFFVDPLGSDHIGISSNGRNFNNIAGPVQASATNRNIEDGEFHNVKIQWETSTKTLSISFDCVERISTSTDFVSTVFSENPIVYFGFTGSTGNSSNEHVICYEDVSFTSLLPNQSICTGENINTIDATRTGATSYSWTPAINISDTSLPNPVFSPDSTTTYTVEITNICGEIFTDSFTANVQSGGNPGTDGILNLCNIDTAVDLFNSLNGTPDAGGTWSPALSSGTGLFDPNVDPSGIYTYTLTNTGLCVGGSANVNVTVSEAPNPGQDTTIELCDIDSSTDLFSSLEGSPDTGGTWTPPLASGSGIFNPSIDTARTYIYTIAGTSPCPDVSANVIINLNTSKNPGTDGTLALCDSNDPVDLFDSLGGTPDTGGTWTPVLTSGTGIFDPNVDPAGTYTYTFSTNNACPNLSADVVVTVNNEPDAGTNGNVALCESDDPIDLFDNLNGTPDAGGTWMPALTSGTGVFDPNLDAAGRYTYTVDGVAPCVSDAADVLVSVNAAPSAGNDAVVALCNDNDAIDLFDSLGGSPDVGGTWTPVLSSTTGVFDPAVDAPGDYTYTVDGIAPCDPSSAIVSVTVNPVVNAGEDGALGICTSAMPIDLFTLLGGTPDAGGVWSPALTSGSGVFDPTVDISDTYTYLVTAVAPCVDDSAVVVVNVTTSPDAGLDSSVSLCDDGNAINLFNTITGNPDRGGTWNPPLTSGSDIFDPSVDAAGTYTYTVNFIGCTPVSSEMVVTINSVGNAGEDGDLSICKTDNAIDLFDLLNETPDTGGNWTPALASGSGIFDPSVDNPGPYTYTINGIAPCPDDSAVVTVTIYDDLTLIQPDDLRSCDEGNDSVEAFNLEIQSSLITADNLDYSVSYHISQIDADTGDNPLISPYNNIANPQTIYSRVVNGNTGCFDSSINFNLELEEGVVANNDTYEICDDNVEFDNDTSNDFNAFDLVSRNPIILGPNQDPANFNVTYYLTQSDADNATNPLASPFQNTINTQTIFARVTNNTTTCFSTSEVLLRVNPLPAFMLDDSYTICFDSDGVLVNNPPTTIDTGLTTNQYRFEWFLEGVLIVGQTNGSIIPNAPGNYSVTVTNTTTNCTASDQTVVVESAPPVLTARQVSITFVEDNTILATAVNSSPSINTAFEFSLDNGPWVSNTPNDGTFTFENVSAGEHEITARDINGCGEAQTSILIIDYIPYFTPNGDGFHDTWNILGIEDQPDAVIYIFNRFGKLLKQLSPIGTGWDGTYNGEILPTSDYWFTLQYNEPNTNERKTFKAHFTLKK